jgi:beta-galactosidase
LIAAQTGRGIVYVEGISGGTGVAARIRSGNGASANIVVLSREHALNMWKANLAGRERLVLSSSQLYFDQNRVHVIGSDPSSLRIAILPAPDHNASGFVPESEDGIFKNYVARMQQVSSEAKVQKLHKPGDLPSVKMGNEVPMVPDESAFETAASWADVRGFSKSPSKPMVPRAMGPA